MASGGSSWEPDGTARAPEAAPARRARAERARHVADRLASLTGLRPASTKLGHLPHELLNRQVPAPDALVREYRDVLKPRTHNALCQHQPGAATEAWTVRRLLEIRGFGIYSPLDVLDVLARYGA